MLLSEAVMLGSTQLKLNAYVYMGHDCGCLLGMGMQANGINLAVMGLTTAVAQEIEIVYRYPWITKKFDVPEAQRTVKLPTDSSFRHYADVRDNTNARAVEIISLWAVMVQTETATLEQAVDWIRSVEPQETPEEKREIVEAFCESLVNGR